MRGNRCEVYINDVKSKLFPLGSSGCRSNLPAALFGMTVSINEAGKEKENITKQRDSKKKDASKVDEQRNSLADGTGQIGGLRLGAVLPHAVQVEAVRIKEL